MTAQAGAVDARVFAESFCEIWVPSLHKGRVLDLVHATRISYQRVGENELARKGLERILPYGSPLRMNSKKTVCRIV